MAYTTIKKPSDYFNTKLYTGTGAEHNITGVGFQPDWTWIKERNSVTSHRVFDIIRGATVEMFPDLTDGESTDAQSLKSFDSDGFTLGTDGATNGSSDTYVAWNWLASNTTASNTDGSITSTVSANTTSGFSIVSYTGTGANATVGHGLGSDVSMVMIKDRDIARNWFVHHKDLGGVACLNLDTTDIPFSPGIAAFQNPPLTSSLIQLATNVSVNNSGNNYIAYCFSEVKGFSKFGSYTGNGNADGSFIYTGFKPAFLIVKNTTTATSWQLVDNKRSDAGGNNIIDKVLAPNATDAEYDAGTSDWVVDFVSNGFKLRGNYAAWNTSGNNYIYMAFAEEPLVGDNPATAR